MIESRMREEISPPVNNKKKNLIVSDNKLNDPECL